MTKPYTARCPSLDLSENSEQETEFVKHNNEIISEFRQNVIQFHTWLNSSKTASAITAMKQCAVCHEKDGDIEKCKSCNKHYHETCGGPHPDSVSGLCVDCKATEGVISEGSGVGEEIFSQDTSVRETLELANAIEWLQRRLENRQEIFDGKEFLVKIEALEKRVDTLERKFTKR